MEQQTWIHIIADSVVVGMIAWAISILKSFIQTILEKTDLHEDRLNVHDRISSQIIHQNFDSESIAKGTQSYPRVNGHLK